MLLYFFFFGRDCCQWFSDYGDMFKNSLNHI
jgi:hypothetical protein